MAHFSQRILVILDRSISHTGKATAVVCIFLQKFSGWALVLGPCIKPRKICGAFRFHKAFVATESRIVLPETDHVIPGLFLSVIFLKALNLPKNVLFKNNLSSLRFSFILLLWIQIVRVSLRYCWILGSSTASNASNLGLFSSVTFSKKGGYGYKFFNSPWC